MKGCIPIIKDKEHLILNNLLLLLLLSRFQVKEKINHDVELI
jgi:hypothetical protein